VEKTIETVKLKSKEHHNVEQMGSGAGKLGRKVRIIL